jgi:hypothetical protein
MTGKPQCPGPRAPRGPRRASRRGPALAGGPGVTPSHGRRPRAAERPGPPAGACPLMWDRSATPQPKPTVTTPPAGVSVMGSCLAGAPASPDCGATAHTHSPSAGRAGVGIQFAARGTLGRPPSSKQLAGGPHEVPEFEPHPHPVRNGSLRSNSVRRVPGGVSKNTYRRKEERRCPDAREPWRRSVPRLRNRRSN